MPDTTTALDLYFDLQCSMEAVKDFWFWQRWGEDYEHYLELLRKSCQTVSQHIEHARFELSDRTILKLLLDEAEELLFTRTFA